MRESRSPPPFNEEPQISKDFWGFFVFSSRGSFSSPLVFSSRWILVCHADFADDADFFSLIILVPQISRINTDFFHWLFFSWIYTDFLWFSSFPAISSFSCHFFISQILDLSVWEDDADFWFHELEKDYADFSNSLFFLFWIHWFLYIINLLIRHFSDPYFFYQFRFISLFFYQFLLVSLI